MRKLAILALSSLLSANLAFAGSLNSTTDSFDANNEASFSGYQSYTQNNYSDGESYRINGVKCPVPTMVFGANAAGTDVNGHDPRNYGATIGIQIPLFTGRCEDAANAELKGMQWKLLDAQQDAIRKQELHDLEKMKICGFMIGKGFELPTEYCNGLEQVKSTAYLDTEIYAK